MPLLSALESAFRFFNGEEVLLDILLKNLDVNERDSLGNTALHEVVNKTNKLHRDGWNHHDLSVRSRMESITLKLLAMGADINICNECGDTPLLYAAKDSQVDTVRILLQNKADPDIKNLMGDTPLLYVIKHFDDRLGHSAKIVRLLLESGTNVNARDRNGQTALEHVINKGSVTDRDLFTELIIWGGSLFVSNKDGVRLLDKLIYTEESFSLPKLQAALVEYIIALQCANLDCSEYAIVESALPFEKFITLRAKARRRIEAIKNVKCGSFLLFDVFGKYSEPTFVVDTNLEDAVKKASFRVICLDYGSLLRAKFVSAKKRYKMMVQAMDKITDKLPNEIVWKILTFLRDEDLESVTTALSL